MRVLGTELNPMEEEPAFLAGELSLQPHTIILLKKTNYTIKLKVL